MDNYNNGRRKEIIKDRLRGIASMAVCRQVVVSENEIDALAEQILSLSGDRTEVKRYVTGLIYKFDGNFSRVVFYKLCRSNSQMHQALDEALDKAAEKVIIDRSENCGTEKENS